MSYSNEKHRELYLFSNDEHHQLYHLSITNSIISKSRILEGNSRDTWNAAEWHPCRKTARVSLERASF